MSRRLTDANLVTSWDFYFLKALAAPLLGMFLSLIKFQGNVPILEHIPSFQSIQTAPVVKPVVVIIGRGIGVDYGFAQTSGIDSWMDSYWDLTIRHRMMHMEEYQQLEPYGAVVIKEDSLNARKKN